MDDLVENRELLARRLKREGYEVTTAEDGQAALDAVRAAPFDVVLLDVMMPGLSGIDVVRALRETRGPASLPVIMVTAVHEADGVVEALEAGANDYVTKPFEYPILRARVRNQIRLKRYHDLKDQFVRIASHDLKNPLTNVTGSVDLVLQSAPLDDGDRQLLEISLRGCERMARIIRDFLDFHALEDGAVKLEMERVDLSERIDEVVSGLERERKRKKIELELDLERPLRVRADPHRIDQVLSNLVSNLLKFSQPGSGGIVRARRADDGVLVEVIDRGPGFTDDDLGRVFTRYGRGSSRPTGGERSTGLGLSICRQIVELHGGTTGARNNEDGVGATVWFQVPTSPAPA